MSYAKGIQGRKQGYEQKQMHGEGNNQDQECRGHGVAETSMRAGAKAGAEVGAAVKLS